MKHTKWIICTGLFAIVLINAAMVNAQSSSKDPKNEAQIRWEATSPMANLYLKNAPASAFIAQGDNEKSQWNNYAGALMYYLAATDRDAKNAWGPYQAAAALAYLDVPEKAKEYLLEADKGGFWQYITAEEDEEMTSIKNTNEFKLLLANAKKRYTDHAKDAGQSFIKIPKGKAPQGGWPVLVWLSGYGTEGTDSQDLAYILVGNKAVFIGINGTEKLGEHRFRWARTETESTHNAVKKALLNAEQQAPVNKDRIALVGFSQGSLHSAHLLASHPEVYCGAILLSPGGAQKYIKASAPSGKRIVLSYGEKEHSSNRDLDERLKSYFTPGNKLKIVPHGGGHFFDDAWKEKYPGYVDYVLDLKES
jgi:predicted esterase